ncbi:class I SAM-dependent DNA methyltransferase [Novipirellula artificiosorum]|uniref:dTDP-3-amino-3,4, 6-trideoxy-alpha-D-glucopyranose n=1 Tax=Novipirellula artificiosorum TaxID=2528016 RepID=A0A5C6DCM4_9BACT|nr:class I SAM-dependent methyltransferase [Novipirellula artificiosorum]TWU34522.1 dTDP-3-amino-3,4,6-trideoxy-alpha-D-glucopyranose [Novipirellula artificiosorum]
MSDTFAAYSRYYDLLYKDKDYTAEAAYIRTLFDRFAWGAQDSLELGCGTGKHACLLAEQGISVTGIDRSAEMIKAAISRAATVTSVASGKLQFLQGDARTVELTQRFETVMSLFHVVSYQTANDDVTAVFRTASNHLKPNGIFVFDVWYGPAVLSVLPSVRVKRMEDDAVRVLRIAEPTIDVNRNRVEVCYTVMVTRKADGRTETFTETHPMRYFFAPELALFADAAGMELVHSEQWIDGATASSDTWGVTFVARKRLTP